MRRASPGGGREPAGERADEVAELIGLLDGERQVERGEQRWQPVESFRPQFGAEPALCFFLCSVLGR